MADCAEREKLKTEACHAINDIVEFSGRLLIALNSQDPTSFTPLDKDLENAVGAKERAFGALAQHRKDHGC
jgi:hypothetical protein